MEVYAEQQRFAQHNPLVHRPLAELAAAQTLAENSLGRLAGLRGRQARFREEQRLQAAVYAMVRHFVGRSINTGNWSTGTARSASAPAPPNRP